MRVFVTDQHRQRFREYGAIEFEGLLTKERCAAWFSLAQKQLDGRNALPGGRCLWRKEPALRRFLQARYLGEVAFELTNVSPLRLGADSFLSEQAFGMIPATAPLEELTCYTGLACGLLIRLTEADLPLEAPFVPQQVGGGVYLAPQSSLDLRELLAETSGSFVLITYVSGNARYVHREKDPHRHVDQIEGYSSGDRLREAEHPILYR